MKKQLFLFLCFALCFTSFSQSLLLQSPSSTLNVGDLDIAGDKITVEALIYINANSGINVVSKHTSPANVNYLLRPITFEITTYTAGNSGSTKFLQMFNPYKLSPGKWYHIAGTYDGAFVKYYVNGCLVIEMPWSGNLYQNDLLTSIGNQSTCQCESFNGQIDEVRIWNVCRTQPEIASNMLSLANPTTQPGLQAYYTFSGNYRNMQGDSRWHGTEIGSITLSPQEASLEKFLITSVQTQNADCPRSKSGTITITSTRAEAMYAIDGGPFQSSSLFSGVAAGSHRVSARTPEGCILDSTVQVGHNGNSIRKTASATICQGSSLFGYTQSGVYTDTLRPPAACDTIRTLDLTVLPLKRTSLKTGICQGETFTLPSGKMVTNSGIFHDTLRYREGCDSAILTAEISVKQAITLTERKALCPGDPYQLPWGTIVYSTGIYSDTIRYRAGCDSLIHTVSLSVVLPSFKHVNETICANENYALPWGPLVSQAGNYQDTLRSSNGCDSIIWQVNLRVLPLPQVSVSKSNDIDCMLGTAKLQATGGISYQWLPVSTLSHPATPNPTAAPGASTTYKVTVTGANGCTIEDSIAVNVVAGNPENGYLVPSAFSPNGDGRNDCFGVPHWGAVSNFLLTVYNRWGDVVFKTNNASGCWNGTLNGTRQETGSYVYLITATTTCGNVTRKGVVNLIR